MHAHSVPDGWCPPQFRFPQRVRSQGSLTPYHKWDSLRGQEPLTSDATASNIYISAHRKKNVLLDYFHAYFFITFSEREGKAFSISWKKSKIILAVNFFSADEIFQNRVKIF